jgi:hypothetical protein
MFSTDMESVSTGVADYTPQVAGVKPEMGWRRRTQGKFATAANPLGFHVLAWTVPLEATPQPLPAKARTPDHFAQGRCRAHTPMFGAGWWI